MWWILLLQTNGPAWVGPVAAVSLLVIALVYLAIGIVLLLAVRAVAAKQRALGEAVRDLRRDLAPALDSVRRIAADGQEITRLVRQEAAGVVHTTRKIRRRVDDLADRMDERIRDLEALYEVVHEEVEDTALDVAAGLRRVRSGGGWLRRFSHLLAGGQRG